MEPATITRDITCFPTSNVHITTNYGRIAFVLALHNQSYLHRILVTISTYVGVHTMLRTQPNSCWKADMILGSSYSMYPVKNGGWSDVCLGSNKNGIHRATLDDPMHYLDGGSFLYLAQVTCLSMTETERYEC